MPEPKALAAMLISAIVGLLAGLLTLHLLGQPTPFRAA
jgi:hypothetical protein